MDSDGVTITAYEDGPLLVRGPVTYRTQDGQVVDPGQTTKTQNQNKKTTNKPNNNNTHKQARFRAPSAPDPRRVQPLD